MGIEPTRPAWKAGILPLNYTRIALSYQSLLILAQPNCFVKSQKGGCSQKGGILYGNYCEDIVY